MQFTKILSKARMVWILTQLVGHILKVKEIQKAAPRVEDAFDQLTKEANNAR